MADKTGIEWTDATWVTVTGCTKVTSGCDHCYSEVLTERLQRMGQPKYAAGFGVVKPHANTLPIPLRWRAPRKIFVNSMSDTFHVDVPEDFTDRMFAVMALSRRHTYQILTKRPQRAANYLSDPETPWRIHAVLKREYPQARQPNYVRNAPPNPIIERFAPTAPGPKSIELSGQPWPLPNVWIGTSVEDSRVTHRIDALRNCPAAVRFLSCEPLIGPLPNLNLDGIHWVIGGGESGQHHRPCNPEWARDLRDQCVAAGVPFFFKQWGGFTPKSGGKELDGREWCEFPTVAA